MTSPTRLFAEEATLAFLFVTIRSDLAYCQLLKTLIHLARSAGNMHAVPILQILVKNKVIRKHLEQKIKNNFDWYIRATCVSLIL